MKLLFAGIGILMVALTVVGFLLVQSYKREGALQVQLSTATARLKEINNVVKEMDAVHGTNNALPDDKLFDSLRPAPSP